MQHTTHTHSLMPPLFRGLVHRTQSGGEISDASQGRKVTTATPKRDTLKSFIFWADRRCHCCQSARRSLLDLFFAPAPASWEPETLSCYVAASLLTDAPLSTSTVTCTHGSGIVSKSKTALFPTLNSKSRVLRFRQRFQQANFTWTFDPGIGNGLTLPARFAFIWEKVQLFQRFNFRFSG